MGFQKIMWGSILLVDFRLNGFDILPDFIGYILIFLGLSEVMHLHPNFKLARTLAGILIIPSIFSLYQNPNTANTGVNPLLMIIGIIVTVIYLVYVYQLYTGIRDKAIEANNHDLAGKADLCWKLIFGLNAAILLAFVIPFLVILLFIFSIILVVYEVMILKTASEVIPLTS